MIFRLIIVILLFGDYMKDNPLLKCAEQLAVDIDNLCKSLHNKGSSNTVYQIRKSSSSVFANITEAQYPQSLADMLSKLKIATGSLGKMPNG